MSNNWNCRALVIVAAFALGAGTAAADVIFATTDLHADSSANLVYQGTTYNPQMSIDASDAVSSQALAGTPQTPDARTAARVNGNEIAVNARLDGKSLFTQTNIDTNQSSAVYSATLTNLSGASADIMLNFFIPPSYVETTTNGELRSIHVNPFIDAFIDVARCTSFVDCGPSTEVFNFQAFLDSTFQSYAKGDFVLTAPPGMDVSPLLNPTITDVTNRTGAFSRTVHMGFSAFDGTLDLGTLDAGQFLKFSYTMQARATGVAASTVGIASMNDPFFFDTDPVTAGAPITVTTVPLSSIVPEPGSWGLLAAAAALLALFRQRRRRGNVYNKGESVGGVAQVDRATAF